jgi:hypothetical protein
MKKKTTVDPKFLVFIVIVCFLLSLLLFFIFDVPSSTMDPTDISIDKEIGSQELQTLKRDGIATEDLEKLLRDYDKKRRK